MRRVSPAVSVVIPTRDRQQILAATLERVGAQQPPAGGYEVVVADNGSVDGTRELVAGLATSFPVPLTLVEAPTPGPAAARNAGLAAAGGDVVLFIGDDMEPADDAFVEGHAVVHASAGHERVVMGRVEWNRRRPVSRFMDWLASDGPAFDFESLARGRVPAQRLCTANLSIARSLLDAVGSFDERFRDLEDTDLGVRLERAGAALEYEPDLLVLHDHPTSLAESLARMARVAGSARLYNEVHPDRALAELPAPRGPGWWTVRAAEPLARAVASERAPRGVRERAWSTLHLAAYASGYRKAVRHG
jgi:glycosyltransferase involved in cell wall biosynthesis